MSVWQILAVVAVGVAYGILEPGRFTYALGHATLYVFLPPLLFEASWNLHYRAIVRQWRAIAVLAGPGVAITALLVAGALAIVRVPFGPALLTGAILSATDPIAVVAVFRRLRVPVMLATIVECESLFNDAVAVVLYRAVLAAMVAGALTWAGMFRIAVLAAAGSLGGIAVGAGLAYAAAWALGRRANAPVQIAATVACAYGAYFAADYAGMSGIFATIAFGIALRFFERRRISLTIAEDVKRFWDVAAILANALVFFMLGASLQIGEVAREPVFVIAALIVIWLSRGVVAGLLLPGGYPRAWLDVVRVAGVRGALSIALALALPESVPFRGAIVDASFAVAIATLASASITVTAAVRRAAKPSS
jgi:monovalent cation:H+ antiporter, CPA1 family